jgi:hypothetical protein
MPIFNTPTVYRRWTGWMIASVVVLGLGESRLIGLVTSGGIKPGIHASFQTNRAEQKAPRDLNNSIPAVTVRETLNGSTRTVDEMSHPRPQPMRVVAWSHLLCLPFHAYESPRAPPRWG